MHVLLLFMVVSLLLALLALLALSACFAGFPGLAGFAGSLAAGWLATLMLCYTVAGWLVARLLASQTPAACWRRLLLICWVAGLLAS